MSDAGDRKLTEFRVVWPLLVHDSIPVANQFLLQPGTPAQNAPNDGGFYLTFGHVSPPVLLGNLDDRERAAESFNHEVPAVVLGRYYLTFARAAELLKLLEQVVPRADADGQGLEQATDGESG